MRIFAGLLALAALVSCGESDPCGSAGMAEIMAQKFVKRELRDPDSASFENTKAERAKDDDCAYVVRGTFRAKNGFGGVTPGVFIVEMRRKKGENSWSAHDLIVQ